MEEQVERCRRLARAIGDDGVRERLTTLAVEYEEQLRQLKSRAVEERSFAPKDGG